MATTTATDLMKSGILPLKARSVKSSSVVKWVVLAGSRRGRHHVHDDQNVKFCFGFAIISTFITIGMSVAGF